MRGHPREPRTSANPSSIGRFQRYIGIDYSGAEVPVASLPGLRVFRAEGDAPCEEVLPPPSPRWYWSRREIAEWLVTVLSQNIPTLVGIDHGFSFPLKYFERHELPHDWTVFLEDFRKHWPTDDRNMYVDYIREAVYGNGAARSGDSRWKRLTEVKTGKAKSVFHFDVPGSVAKSTHAGIPWLLYLRQNLGRKVHFWPFDGWTPPSGVSVIAEVYPSLWNKLLPMEGRTRDQHDALVIVEFLRLADHTSKLSQFFTPELTPENRITAEIEGWILGVV
jgi:hypothetical protein